MARADYESHLEVLDAWVRERRKAGVLVPELIAELDALAIEESRRTDVRHREKAGRVAKERRARYQQALADAHAYVLERLLHQ